MAEDAREAWAALLLEQGYFINRLCVYPRTTHLARGVDLDETDDMFVEELQKEIDNCLPEVMKGVERHIRVLPVSEGVWVLQTSA